VAWVETFFRPTVDVGFLYVRLLYGINLEAASPEQAVVGVKTPILLIHGLDDTYIPPYNSDLIQAKNPAIVVWKVPGAVHVGATPPRRKNSNAECLDGSRSTRRLPNQRVLQSRTES
jgi:fermentation-respiration switch protein FrsA (DUF1100 family)